MSLINRNALYYFPSQTVELLLHICTFPCIIQFSPQSIIILSHPLINLDCQQYINNVFNFRTQLWIFLRICLDMSWKKTTENMWYSIIPYIPYTQIWRHLYSLSPQTQAAIGMTLNTPRGATERGEEEGGELDKFAINIIYILTKANCCDLHNNLTGPITIWPIDLD